MLALTLPVVASVVVVSVTRWDQLASWRVLFWVVVIAFADLLPVQSAGGFRFSMGVPLYFTLGALYSPPIVLVVAFVAAVDIRELSERQLLRSLFNRSQIALTQFIGSLVFHSIASQGVSSGLFVPGAICYALVAYTVNTGLVALGGTLSLGLSLKEMIRGLRVGSRLEFFLSFGALACFGALLARVYVELKNGEWAILAFVLPIMLLARQSLVHAREIERESDLLRHRESALRLLSGRLAEERHDERVQIASALHDEAIQGVMHSNLLINAGQNALNHGKVQDIPELLQELRDANQASLAALRTVVSDLRQSALGREGLEGALRKAVEEVRRRSHIEVHLTLRAGNLSDPVQLLVYQIAREAILNAEHHSGASNVQVAFVPIGRELQLTVEDDGDGFDPSRVPEGHFGLVLMRERAHALGGELQISSAAGGGTIVRMTYPLGDQVT